MISNEIELHRRPNVPMIALFVTDGPSANKAATSKAAKNLHKNHISMFVIAIGNPRNNDEEELSEIASMPSCQFLFSLKTFKDLDLMSNFLGKKIADGNID